MLQEVLSERIPEGPSRLPGSSSSELHHQQQPAQIRMESPYRQTAQNAS